MLTTNSVAPFAYPGYVLNAPAGEYGSGDALGALADGWASVLADDDGQPEPEPTSENHRREAEEDSNEPEPEEDEREEGEEEPEEDSEEPDEEDDSEADSDDDESSDEEGEDDNEPASDTSKDGQSKVKVTVNGQEQEVTLDELRAGYSRTQDYTVKTQQLAQQRRQLQEQEDTVQQTRQAWLTSLQQLEDAAQARRALYSDAELQRLRDEDHYAYTQALESQRKVDDQLNKIAQAREATQAEYQQAMQKQTQRQLQAEFEMLQSKLPEWSEESTRTQELSAISKYAKDLGFSDQEISGIGDHRMYLVLRDAAKYRASQQRTAEVKDKAAKATAKAKPKATGNLKAGKPQSPSARKTAKAKRSQQRFQKTGSVRDAASWIEDNLL